VPSTTSNAVPIRLAFLSDAITDMTVSSGCNSQGSQCDDSSRQPARAIYSLPRYNLLYREEEREMLPFCADQGIGSIPWRPLARGRLTRPWTEQTNRSESDEFGRTIYTEDDRPIVEAVIDLADKRGVTPAQIALAWLLSKPVVSSPIVGATKEHHLADAVAAVDLRLDDAEIELLEEGYQPHPVLGIDIGCRPRPTR